MPLVQTESRDSSNLPMMREIGEILAQAYPGYSWLVRIDGGLLMISTSDINGHYGRQTALRMVRYFSDIAHDAEVRKRQVIMAAGELLERAHLRRGRSREEKPKVFEGGEIADWSPPIA